MLLRDLLPEDHLLVPLEARTLREALDRLIHRLQQSGEIGSDIELGDVFDASQLRGAVAIGSDVALPHFRTDAVRGLVLALGISPEPLAADDAGLEIRPRIVALVLAPAETATLYLQTISTLARLFRRAELRDGLLRSRSVEEAMAVIRKADLRVQPRLTVRDVMMPARAKVSADDSVRDAVDLMIRHRIGVVPVVGEKGEVLGTITDRDVMRGFMTTMPRAGESDTEQIEPAALADIRVRDLMSRLVLCISEDSGLDEAASILINKDVPQLPVVAEGQLTGLLGRGDIIRKLFGR
ncbi:MAG: CBS domain-containing protein [Longimicrobiales bacterium]